MMSGACQTLSKKNRTFTVSAFLSAKAHKKRKTIILAAHTSARIDTSGNEKGGNSRCRPFAVA